MRISDVLAPANALLDVRATDKVNLLQHLARRAGEALSLDPDSISHEILRREDLGSTGTGAGVAIPHARLSQLEKPFGIFARLHRPVEFDAIDRQPIDLIFCLLLPTASRGEQLTALACVARKLRNPDLIRKLRGAKGGDTLYRLICDDVVQAVT